MNGGHIQGDGAGQRRGAVFQAILDVDGDGGVLIMIGRRREGDIGQGAVDVGHRVVDGPDAGAAGVGRRAAGGEGTSGGIGQGQGGGDGFTAVHIADDDIGQGDTAVILAPGAGGRGIGGTGLVIDRRHVQGDGAGHRHGAVLQTIGDVDGKGGVLVLVGRGGERDRRQGQIDVGHGIGDRPDPGAGGIGGAAAGGEGARRRVGQGQGGGDGFAGIDIADDDIGQIDAAVILGIGGGDRGVGGAGLIIDGGDGDGGINGIPAQMFRSTAGGGLDGKTTGGIGIGGGPEIEIGGGPGGGDEITTGNRGAVTGVAVQAATADGGDSIVAGIGVIGGVAGDGDGAAVGVLIDGGTVDGRRVLKGDRRQPGIQTADLTGAVTATGNGHIGRVAVTGDENPSRTIQLQTVKTGIIRAGTAHITAINERAAITVDTEQDHVIATGIGALQRIGGYRHVAGGTETGNPGIAIAVHIDGNGPGVGIPFDVGAVGHGAVGIEFGDITGLHGVAGAILGAVQHRKVGAGGITGHIGLTAAVNGDAVDPFRIGSPQVGAVGERAVAVELADETVLAAIQSGIIGVEGRKIVGERIPPPHRHCRCHRRRWRDHSHCRRRLPDKCYIRDWYHPHSTC